MRLRLLFKYSFILLVVVLAMGASATLGQTSNFTYQGRLSDGGTPANGNYDLQFVLFDSLSGGAQVGSTQNVNTVAVSNGVFTVSLDFGPNSFPGANRFLEISARPTGGSFTLLTPRQQITSTPYAVRSLNAASADSVPASGVPAGSGNYIQSNPSAQQTASFNISGNGTAGGTLSGNVLNATTQFNLNGSRILSNPGSRNLFAGFGAGAANVTGNSNSFFGVFAGAASTGTDNSFFGGLAGEANTSGCCNSFFGLEAGGANTTGNFNSFFGHVTGGNSQMGSRNTLLGAFAFVGSGNLTNATAIGANARVDASDALVLGSINGINGATANTNVGIGTTQPAARLHVVGDTGLIGGLGIGTTTPLRTLQIGGSIDSLFTLDPSNGSPNAGFIRFGDNTGWKLHFGRNREGSAGALNPGTTGVLMTIQDNGNVGIGTTAPDNKLTVNGTADKPGAGSWGNFSDERLKNLKGRFTPGLRALMRLQPLRYEYKRDNALNLKSEGEHIGFSAQAVQKIIPEAVTANDKGYLLVNNDPIMWTMLNAIKEQQAQIERQQKQIEGLKKLVCRSRPRASACR